MGKSTISMAMFNSYVTNYQRVYTKSFNFLDLDASPAKKDFLIFAIHANAKLGFT